MELSTYDGAQQQCHSKCMLLLPLLQARFAAPPLGEASWGILGVSRNVAARVQVQPCIHHITSHLLPVAIVSLASAAEGGGLRGAVLAQ